VVLNSWFNSCEIDKQSQCSESVAPDTGASSIIRAPDLPEFREYASRKYPELDEDLITMIEDLIKRQSQKIGRTETRC